MSASARSWIWERINQVPLSLLRLLVIGVCVRGWLTSIAVFKLRQRGASKDQWRADGQTHVERAT